MSCDDNDIEDRLRKRIIEQADEILKLKSQLKELQEKYDNLESQYWDISDTFYNES